jgi:hypothetical protein
VPPTAAGAKPSSATTAVENGELVNVRGNKHYFGIFDSERTWDELYLILNC